MTAQTDNTAQTAGTTVRIGVDVAAPVERAFEVFTRGMATWWPPDHHVLRGVLDRMVLEPHTGGRLFDVNTDGVECTWGEVEAWDPPHAFAFRWLVGPDWQVHESAASSRVTVTFTATRPGHTRVELVHDQLDRHGDGWQVVRDGVGSPTGWPRDLLGFAAAAGAA